VTTATLLDGLLAYVLLPAWLVAGFADWLCHRATSIERTSGTRESTLHVVLYFEIAVPLVAALFLEPTRFVVALCAVGATVHLATSLWDTSVAQPRRYISPIEQQVHSWLEMLPVFALSVFVVRHWETLRIADWRVVGRVASHGSMLVAALLVVGLSFPLEELIRCARASGQDGRAPRAG
jgi:hypothetical protein